MLKQNMPVGAMLLRLIVVLLPAAGLGMPAHAQESRVPSAEEIIRKLQSFQISPDSLRNDAVATEGRRKRVEQSPSINLEVNFEYASARLTPDARIVLDNLGQALSDPTLRDSRFRIAGHTDARGSDAYNLSLSRQRARSVADYLMRQHHVGAQRLDIEGYGRSQLLDPANPESAVNRRVQIINLGS